MRTDPFRSPRMEFGIGAPDRQVANPHLFRVELGCKESAVGLNLTPSYRAERNPFV